VSAVREVINKLECSLQSSSSSERLHMLRAVTDLYLEGVATHSGESIELFDQALNQLIDYVEAHALARLSTQLAPIDMAPFRTVQRLARHDDINIAEPLLRESRRLGTIDLVVIANTKSQGHLAAIGTRSEIEEAVTDILVTKGNTDVARIVATNTGARFWEATFSNLVTRAETEVGLAEITAVRSEMKPQHFRQLLERASATVRRRLMSISDPRTHAKIKKEIAQIAREIDRAGAPPKRDFSTAEALLSSMERDPGGLRSKLLDYAAQGRMEETIVALAILADLNATAVDKIVTKSDDGGILLLCRGIGLDWRTTSAILALCSGEPQGKGLDESFARFERLTDLTARRVLRFWQVRASMTERNAKMERIS
jgi:uncharacterized protein (DUF2336 family)